VASTPIDVWNAKTFDPDLMARLERETELVCKYMRTDHKITLDHDLGREKRSSVLRPDNPYAADFNRLQEAIGREMESRSIRTWHYSRLTDAEVAAMHREGVHLSTPNTLQARLSEVA
jgi:hypothetical protein